MRTLGGLFNGAEFGGRDALRVKELGQAREAAVSLSPCPEEEAQERSNYVFSFCGVFVNFGSGIQRI